MRKLYVAALVIMVLVSCSGKNQNFDPAVVISAIDTPAVTATQTPMPTEIPIPPTPTPDYINEICSPLQGLTLQDLPEIITQSFDMPDVDNDNGHHGVDFSFFHYKNINGIEALPVLAAMQGEVVTILNDRPPYGYGIIIETPLNEINQALLTALQFPEVQPTIQPVRVNCPTNIKLTFTLSETERSLYILYGHLKDLPVVRVGDYVSCGQSIGLVGNSGTSTNPHLHFETRVGPSGARFESMAYYTVQSTQAERYNYCIWRVSNQFQLFDPMSLLSAQN